MDWQQASQLIKFLDEEHRRDRAKLSGLEFKADSQAEELAALARRVQEQAESLAEFTEALARLGEFRGALEGAKEEILTLMNQVEVRGRREHEALGQSRKDDWSSFSQTIAALEAKLAGISWIEERIAALRMESDRTIAALQELQSRLPELSQRIDEQVARLPYLEERARQEAKRLGELGGWVEELVKRVQSLNPRLVALDERVARTQQGLEKLANLGEDLKGEYQAFAEEMRLAERERAQRMAQWRGDMAEHSAEIQRFSQRWQEFQEHLTQARQVLEALTGLEGRILEEMRSMAERQRVAEESLRLEQDRWQKDNDSLWRKHELEWHGHLEEWRAFGTRVLERFAQMEDWRREEMATLKEVRELLEGERQERRTCQEWLEALRALEKELVGRTVQDLESWLGRSEERTERWKEARRD